MLLGLGSESAAGQVIRDGPNIEYVMWDSAVRDTLRDPF